MSAPKESIQVKYQTAVQPAPEKGAKFHIKKQVWFCYGHRLRDYAGPCKHIHGHNAKVEVELSSNRLDRRGMVADFIEVGNIIKNWIDKTFDHKLLLRQDDPLISLLKEQGEPLFVMEENPTAEHIAQLIYDYAVSQNLPISSVTLWETESSCATYFGP